MIDAWAAWLQAGDIAVLGSPVTRAEWLGAVLALAMVGFNARMHPMGWPLACLSSLLYAVVFMGGRLYGQALLQLLFVVMALWGLWKWTRGAEEAGLAARRMPARLRLTAAASVLLLWVVLGWLLARFTDNPLPYGDALPTAGSVVATWLLAQRYLENWAAWAAVNAVSVALFAHQGLWPTVALYAVFCGLSVWGWRQWRTRQEEAQQVGTGGGTA